MSAHKASMACVTVVLWLVVCVPPVLPQTTVAEHHHFTGDHHSDVTQIVELLSHHLTQEVAELERKVSGNLEAEIRRGINAAVIEVTQNVTDLDENVIQLQTRVQQQMRQLKDAIKNTVVDLNRIIQNLENKTAEIHGQLNEVKGMMEAEIREKSRSCAAIHHHYPGAASGVYTVFPGGTTPGLAVWCNMSADGGGWTVIQHRQDGSVPFDRTWKQYQRGFGSLHGEFWLGLDAMHRLTADQRSVLRVDLQDWTGAVRYAKYSTFSVGKELDNYRLTVNGYSGTAGDSLYYQHHSKQFSTKDRDNDGSYRNCALTQGAGSGWWYGNCSLSNINGRYYIGAQRHPTSGVEWYHWHGVLYSLKAASMMIQPQV